MRIALNQIREAVEQNRAGEQDKIRTQEQKRVNE